MRLAFNFIYKYYRKIGSLISEIVAVFFKAILRNSFLKFTYENVGFKYNRVHNMLPNHFEQLVFSILYCYDIY